MKVQVHNVTMWDDRFMGLARDIKQWSKDVGRKVGAVIVKDDKYVVSVGYNGLPAGSDDTLVNTDAKNALTIHAEMNAILNSRTLSDIKGSTMYVAGMCPCIDCAKAIVQSGVSRVVFDSMPMANSKWFHSCSQALALFKTHKIPYKCITPFVIMISGPKGSGKSYLASELCKLIPRSYTASFADPIKSIISKTFDLDRSELELLKNDNRYVFNNMTARRLIQRFGTEAMQDVFGKTVWRDDMMRYLRELALLNIDVVIIDDYRFKHEYIPGALTIRINHDASNGDNNHISEHDLDNETFYLNIERPSHDDIVNIANTIKNAIPKL